MNMIRKKNVKQPDCKKENGKEKNETQQGRKQTNPWQQLLGELLHKMLNLE
jgi:hypothetical protein